MRERSDKKNDGDLPPQLLRPTPRPVEPNPAGIIVLVSAGVLAGAAVCIGTWLYSNAEASQQVGWPAFLIPPALGTAATVIVHLVRRQRRLLSEGRAALATVTRAEKVVIKGKTSWRVHYEWTLLSGGTRAGRYKVEGKNPPAPGTPVPIVYDRDEPLWHATYPLPLVRLKPS